MSASALAISQSNAKKVLAYSTIANLGLIIACAGIGTPVAIGAAILLIIFHAVSKALMFLCVGTIEQEIGSRDIEDMEGLKKKMPFTATIAAVGAVSMLLPPFGVLVSKWLAIEAAVKMPITLVFIVFGSAFTAVFWTKWIGKLLSTVQNKEAVREKLHPAISTTLAILAATVVIASVGIVPLFNFFVSPRFINASGFKIAGGGGLIEVTNGGVVGSFTYFPVFMVLTAIALAIPFILKKVNPEKVRQPYFCGENCEIDGLVGFRSEADSENKAVFHNYYLSNVFGEERLNAWLSAIGVILLIALLSAGI
jgi:ech hydrogenase subunit A